MEGVTEEISPCRHTTLHAFLKLTFITHLGHHLSQLSFMFRGTWGSCKPGAGQAESWESDHHGTQTARSEDADGMGMAHTEDTCLLSVLTGCHLYLLSCLRLLIVRGRKLVSVVGI